ncbi:MAG: hypothetical protein Q9187_004218 [Circinaria calcarea]
MGRLTDALIALLIPLLIILHLVLSPYTKVEESFNVQATHDILTAGIPLQNRSSRLQAEYDHLSFPGSVPRTFVGPLALAGASWPFIWLIDGVERQVFVRAILGLYNAFCILSFRNGVAKAFGRDAANWYILLQASQFHLMYYASRTLPNFFAFGLSTLAMRNLLPFSTNIHQQSQIKAYKQALVLLTVVGVIFRSEVALLLGIHTIWILLQRRLSLRNSIASGILGLSIGLGLTVPIDSFFWLHFPLWPELSGFAYNVMEGRSVNWGTSPFYHYFTSALPRLLFNPFTYLLCIPLALSTPALRRSALYILIPNLTYVAAYSVQPHKEWRFIIYVIPPLTAVAAAGASWIWTRRTKSLVYRVLALGLVASTAASFLASFGMLLISRLNYPGADALNRLHELADGESSVVKVHMDTLSCMTGVTRFLQIQPTIDSTVARTRNTWIYDKTEDEANLLDPVWWDRFDYVLAERPEKIIGSWEVVDTVNGFAGLRVLKPDEFSGAATKVESRFMTPRKEPLGYCLWHIECALRRIFSTAEVGLRKWVTGGWWVQPIMDAKIRILKHRNKPHGIATD